MQGRLYILISVKFSVIEPGVDFGRAAGLRWLVDAYDLNYGSFSVESFEF